MFSLRLLSLCALLLSAVSLAAAPLRVLLPGTAASPEATAFAKQFAALLEPATAVAKSIPAFPTDADLDAADVLVLYGPELKPDTTMQREALEKFAQRGGGFLVVHGGVAVGDAAWLKPLIGGAWVPEKSKAFTSRMMLYVATDQHPIVRGASAFDLDDETLYDLDLDEHVQVLGSAFTPKTTGARDTKKRQADQNANTERADIYDIQPQLWAYEGGSPGGKTHRAVVSLQGHQTLDHASLRTFFLRGLAWAAHRENLDELCAPADLAALRYPVGGPETPEATARQFQHHPDVTISVVASEPLINKPIAIQWDAQGRLWVAETPEYPNGRRAPVAESWKETGVLDPAHLDRPAVDRISILTDPDAQGKFTKKTVFFEGLELVTGFCLYKDGVIALAQPDIVFIHGTGAAQKVERLYTGFTPGDTHFVGNHLIVAPDGWIYANMGGGANVKTPEGGRPLANITSGMFRFKADGSAIEQVSSKGGNGFGADITSDGELFFGQATSRNPIQHVALPEALLALGKVGKTTGAQSVIEGRDVVIPHLPDRVPLRQIDAVGGYSAACASLVYEGGAWPAEWDRGLFCTEAILNVVHHEALRPQGSTFKGEMVRPEAEFITSPDYWFRPIDVACGPDGALYVLDFYNPVIAHSDSRGPLHSKAGASVRPDREHYFGRIYRVQHKASTPLPQLDLTKLSTPDLAATLRHPNKVVRYQALQQLLERGGADATAALLPLAQGEAYPPARVLALWGAQRLGALTPELLKGALHSTEPAVRKTAALIAEAAGASAVQSDLAAALNDPDPRTRIAMLRGLAAAKLDLASATALVQAFPQLPDDLAKSAAVAAAASSPVVVIQAALAANDPAPLQELVGNIATRMVEQRDADGFVRLATACASAGASSDGLKRLVLEAAARVKVEPKMAVDATALRALLLSPNPEVSTAALPLVIAWDKSGSLRAEVRERIAALLVELSAGRAPEARRGQVIMSLVAARDTDPTILPTIFKVLADSSVPESLKRQAVLAFATTEEPAIARLLAEHYQEMPAPVQQAALELLLTRPAWTVVLLDAIEAGQLKASNLGPANLFRLRSHPDKSLAKRANEVLSKFGKPNEDKAKIIAQLTPTVTQPGDAAKGRELFTAACSVCHKLGDLGKEVGPILTGIGAHGPEQLLVSIVDPNRQIDAGYELFNVELKDGQLQSGIIASENDARLILRSAAGEVEVPRASVKTTTNTHRSLMPEGFDALGGEALRDLLTFICGSEARFRTLDLSEAFTADTRRGLYQSQEAVRDTLQFTRFGIATVEGIPFSLINPESSATGGNIIVLRGGPPESAAHAMPNRVEVKVNMPAKAFHFLGGVAGWGANQAMSNGAQVMKVTMEFADGSKESVPLYNGVEFADYAGRAEVPGSRFAPGIVKEHQIRWFTIPAPHAGVVKKLILESTDRGPAATIAAITADLNPALTPAPL